MGIEKYLRDYQVDAINKIDQYIKSDSKKDCLIKLPTGTGKTGVMAVVANKECNGNILIIVPNGILPYQTKEEIKTLFWDKINYKPNEVKRIEIFKGKFETEFTKDNVKGCILIITIQKLLYIHQNNFNLFENLCEYINVVFYDEGHREPSEQWSIISRILKKKTVLFTATPYRNDNKVFNIDGDYIFNYSIREAIKKKYLKNPKFIAIPDDIFEDYNKIADFIASKLKDRKILVRLKGSNNIVELSKSFVSNIKVACLHSDFNSEDYNSINNFYDNGEEFLKHQHLYDVIIHSDMLCEGINIPSINTIVFLDCFKTFKSMIQQIGRALRANIDDEDAYIYVYENEIEQVEKQWNMYLNFDEGKGKYKYLDGRIREKFGFLKNGKLHEEIKYCKQATVLYSSENMFEKLFEKVINYASANSIIIQSDESIFEKPNYRLWTYGYQREFPSKYFASSYIYDRKFEYASLLEFRIDDNFYYFYYSSQRFLQMEKIDNMHKVSPRYMYNLLPANSNIKKFSFSGTSNQKTGIMNNSLEGESLNLLPESRVERFSVCKNAHVKFYDIKKINRYLGVLTAKISDKESIEYKSYIEWCENLLVQILKGKENVFFSRFAEIVDQPESTPTSILIDFSSIIIYNRDEDEINVESQFCTVEYNKFMFIIDGLEIEAKITSNNDGIITVVFDNMYNFSCRLDNTENINLNVYLLNEHFKIFYSQDQIIYINGTYFKPRINYYYSNPKNFNMFNEIITLKELKNCENEKFGKKPTVSFTARNYWPIDSVFGVLINNINSIYPNVDYLICDDLQKEIADFIAIDTSDMKLIFIHCKFNKSNLSASAFQDVCGQAIKNLEYILTTNPNNQEYLNKHVNLWRNDWKLSHAKKEYSCARNIIGDLEEFISLYKNMMGNPMIKKEICLVTSGLSKGALEKEMRKKAKHEEQYHQLMYLLQSTQDTFAQAGATMKIVCKE